MKRAIESLKIVPSMSLIDGIYTPKVDLNANQLLKVTVNQFQLLQLQF